MLIKIGYLHSDLLQWLQLLHQIMNTHGIQTPHHIISDMANMSIHSQYNGDDTIQVGNSQGLSITHISSSILHNSDNTFQLRDILHCPSAPLISFQFTNFSKIAIVLYILMLMVSLRRTKSRGRSFSKCRLNMVFILFVSTTPIKSDLLFFSMSVSPPLPGALGLVTHRLQLSSSPISVPQSSQSQPQLDCNP